MRVMWSWIASMVGNPDLNPREVGEKLTLCTAEVEAVERVKRNFHRYYVCKVLEVVELGEENGKLYKKAIVEVGDEEYQVVSTAPNLRRGMTTLIALPGAIVLGEKVEEKRIKGVVSCGTLLSPYEAGIGDYKGGIFELSGCLASGEEFASHVREEEWFFELENKSLTNRPDLWGHLGFAREVAAIYSLKLTLPPTVDLSEYDHLPEIEVEVENFKDTPRYSAIAVDNVRVVPSPLWMQERLLGVGSRPRNFLVDVTNYVMWELGQPTHAFDGSKVKRIRVARANPGTVFYPLDGEPLKLTEEDVVIWSGENPVALAGVIGGKGWSVEDETESLLIESANFDMYRVRKTSRRHNIRTDSSSRFEKGQPVANVPFATARILKLLFDEGMGRVRSRFTDVGMRHEHPRPIRTTVDFINGKLGIELSFSEIRDVLDSLGFKVRRDGREIAVEVPPHRSSKDISIPEDLVEEVARIYGYERIVPQMPQVVLQKYHFDKSVEFEKELVKILAVEGFNQVETYSWYSSTFISQIKYAPKAPVELLNPVNEDCRILRDSLIPNLIWVAQKNENYSDEFFLFEVGRVFSQENEVDEKKALCLMGFSVKRGVEELLLELKRKLEIAVSSLTGFYPTYIPARHSLLVPAFEVLMTPKLRTGVGGVLKKEVVHELFRRKPAVVFCELEMRGLFGLGSAPVKYRGVVKFPSTYVDFSVLSGGRPYAELEKIVCGFSHPLLKGWELVDSFKLPGGEKSYTFRFFLQKEDATVVSEEIEEVREKFVQHISSHGLRLRGL